MISPQVFDRGHLRTQRSCLDLSFCGFFTLAEEISKRLCHRLACFAAPFDRILQLGWDGGGLSKALLKMFPNATGIVTDLSEVFLLREGSSPFSKVCLDEEHLAFQGSFDLIISFLGLQHVNDISGSLSQSRHLLKNNGLFFCALIGGESQFSFPMIHPRSLLNLLKHAGFLNTIVDVDKIQLVYPSFKNLMLDMKDSSLDVSCKTNKLGLEILYGIGVSLVTTSSYAGQKRHAQLLR